jgi:hypothetical protein
MKVFNFKSALVMLTFSTMSLFLQAPTQAQVNKQLLSDVIKSCQRDMSIDYFRRMGILVRELNTEPSSQSQKICIRVRYYYGSVIEQLPWLPDSGEIVPGFSASVALSLISGWDQDLANRATEEKILECVISKDFDGSKECSWIRIKLAYTQGYDSQYRKLDVNEGQRKFLPNVCPKCVVTHDDASRSELNRGFINWFLSLDKSKRRDVVSLVSYNSEMRQNLGIKLRMADEAYEDALTKIEQDEKAQRRRNLLGQ